MSTKSQVNLTPLNQRISELKTKINEKHTEYLTWQAKGKEAHAKGNQNSLKLRILPTLVMIKKQASQYIAFLKQAEQMKKAITNTMSRKASAKGGKKNRRTVKNKRNN
jgi:hypothetical protein